MPATRVTIALNSKQSLKAPLLIPASTSADPAASTSIRALVFKTAQSKLRLKKPTRIFVGRTGHELLTEEDWKTNIKDDVVLLLSAGEDFVGVKRESNVHAHANLECPVELLTSNTPVETLAVTQLSTTAHTLPGIVHAVGQPDLHPGSKFPIGAVIASKGWVHPPLIGGDIGCGMAWFKTTLPRSQVDGDKGKKVAEKLRGLEGPWRTQAHREAWMHEEDGSCSTGEEWDIALGTIGAGNHFAEIQVVEESSLSADDKLSLQENDVVLLVHSGSRGYGGSVLKKHTTDAHVSFQEDSPEAIEYIKEHDKACQWAKANRDLIALRFLSCLEPGNEAWDLGSSSSEDVRVDVAAISYARKQLQQRKVVDIWHNNVERVKWPPSPPSTSSDLADAASNLSLSDGKASQDHVWIHRKGAAPTYNPETQQPLELLPLPGSRGTPTLILKPTFSTRTSWGLKNALSLAHGAGRAMTRTKALTSLGAKYKGINILEPRAGDSEGTWVVCDEKDLVFEEAPEAYKDVELVGQDLVDAGVAEIVGRCRARVSYKVRNEAR
ncbi:3'-phosphate/5'-hydroxy nucleic acid ligase [Parastagonospora nodorum]|uniref:3'-phosphate/5'-hydroxy nucleic acid ligase n=1 Tax=Phaeosphaeria nodorum (strain SN15 / ATCC MYA-4574 / FGSC 10173) TaxID=321614 RepID=A0A7U2F974_PHANO|nr:3'-phosphate/5'-hydroxy nucleic acid ligase [Parastagonospora nodorum]QRC99948.1 3'-phosphate/5'-hydroxy nucleic acid ligase [Parastagonospora nodorum SN15]KAH3933866.1 3'-phosphate/5'-hydroxy nucleic acid ligase [Parastagonospora nodorum]KAH3979872.1 3'-phosphate/5'-hydroxy nucleic acid ligase [Parastagonospora nodorum]KAH3980264.1 3'-phosphate/5'-hydroxy nucleic acid ligase [Parastagonospora nodorum]